jgi:hypothetical protein
VTWAVPPSLVATWTWAVSPAWALELGHHLARLQAHGRGGAPGPGRHHHHALAGDEVVGGLDIERHRHQEGAEPRASDRIFVVRRVADRGDGGHGE